MQPDHYEILGVPTTATPEEIKKKYRTLASRYHPDVNPQPDAAQMITRINEAYHVLGDADRRALYNAERMLRAHADAALKANSKTRERTPPRSAAPKSAPPGQKPEFRSQNRNAPPAARSNTSRPVEYNGFGTVPEPKPAAKSPASPQAEAARAATDAFRAMDGLVIEAQLAFINRQYREAESLCFQALQIDRRNATAHEILGDVFVKRGQTDKAMQAYTYAVQHNPLTASPGKFP